MNLTRGDILLFWTKRSIRGSRSVSCLYDFAMHTFPGLVHIVVYKRAAAIYALQSRMETSCQAAATSNHMKIKISGNHNESDGTSFYFSRKRKQCKLDLLASRKLDSKPVVEAVNGH